MLGESSVQRGVCTKGRVAAAPSLEEARVAALAADPAAAKKRKFKFFRVYSILIDLHLIIL